MASSGRVNGHFITSCDESSDCLLDVPNWHEPLPQPPPILGKMKIHKAMKPRIARAGMI